MKRKISIFLLATFLLTTIPCNIEAKMYTDELIADNEEVIKCDYYNEAKEEAVRISIVRTGNGVARAQVRMNVNGQDKSQKLVKVGEEQPSQSALDEAETIEYIMTKGKCPAFIANYDSRYMLSDSKEDLAGSSYILDKVYTKYKENYCFYSFLPDKDWGVFIKKDKFSSFVNGYTGESCPETVITELGVSTDPVENEIYERKFYATDVTAGMPLTVLKQQCDNDVISYLQETYDDASGAKCYIGTRQELITDEWPYTNPYLDPTNPSALDCNGLFDAETKQFVSTAYFIIEVIAILMVVVLSTKDYAVAILNSNADEIKKTNKNLLTRLIIIVIIFLLPAMLKMLLGIFNIELFNSDPLCGTMEKVNK